MCATFSPRFEPIQKCPFDEKLQNKSVVADLDGTLTRTASSFLYFFLVALEGGSLIRAIIFCLFSPLAWLLYNFVSEAAGIQVLIFFSFAGLKLRDIEAVARGVLPKFYAEDVHPHTYNVFASCGRRYVVTANPRVMVESFAKEQLGADMVLGTEIEITEGGRATGFVKKPGTLVGMLKRNAVKVAFGDELPDIGIGDRVTDYPFMCLCKESYIVPKATKLEAVRGEKLLKPMIFHDGRLVNRPTPLMALITILWLPLGVILSIIRVFGCLSLPVRYVPIAYKLLGIRLVVRGEPPLSLAKGGESFLFVCSHRSVIDPVILSVAMGRTITAVTYSVSRLTELLSPIKTVRLSRNRDKDSTFIKELLNNEGDLAICPEGTTCREPFLLRFSCLFAELTDKIVPVAISAKFGVFHGTTVRGWKFMDPFFCFMNPFPQYEITFVDKLPLEMTVNGGGRSSIEVANYVQKAIADVLGFACTNLTRKDKYRKLAGTDGLVPHKG